MEASSSRVQLGTVRLQLPDIPGPSSPSEGWTSLQAIPLEWVTTADEASVIKSLGCLLLDEGVGFAASYRARNGGDVIIRCSFTPSDTPGSNWKRTRWTYGSRSTHLRRVFSEIQTTWNGEDGPYLMSKQPGDSDRMLDLYAAVPSPSEPAFTVSSGAKDDEIYRRLQDCEEPEGIKSRLYKYQFRSVAKMLQMETDPERLIDPLWTPFEEVGRSGRYYVNLANWDVQRHPGWFDLPRGGILCEQMGVGKTLMCLSLILSTLHQPCMPAPTNLDTSHITTAHRERTYPFDTDTHLRALTSFPPKSTKLEFPSLFTLCSNLLAIHDPSASRPSASNPLQIPRRDAFFYQYPPDDSCMREAKRKTLQRETKRIYLANTTLVVVPSILVKQWAQEVKKHVVSEALKVLVVENERLPCITDLISYDMVLMSVDRFGLEQSVTRMTNGMDGSVLLQARWKRLILDEGHVAGSKSTNAMHLAQKLSVERRWAVSGTPTKHLQQGGEAEVSMPSRRHSPAIDEEEPVFGRGWETSQPWSRNDLDDATRLGIIMGGFLATEPFRSDASFQAQVTAHLRGRAGPSFGAVRRMRYLMSALMVKHAPKVIDSEACLPPSTRTIEMLRFHPMQRITFNVLASLVAVNVYTSNFQDQDYFLHPSNVDSFNQVVRNLHLATFWYSARDMGTAECLERVRTHLESNENLSAEGRRHLEEAATHFETALATPGWSEWMANGVSLPFEAGEISLAVRQAWSDSMDTNPDAIDSHSFNLLRQANRRGATEHALHIKGWESRAAKHEEFFEEMEKVAKQADKAEKKERRKKDKADKKHTEKATAAKQPTAVLKAAAKRKALKGKKDGTIDVTETSPSLRTPKKGHRPVSSLDVPDLPRPLPTAVDTISRSAKVNFVVRTILDADAMDKFVIFGDNFELGHLTEALDLFDISSCFAGYGSVAPKRIEALEEFKRPEIRVCLLDLRLAARGLNLVVANRMIFLAPVWNLDVLAQAVKRVHRIGQTRPTKIQILAIEGTFEEDIANRAATARTDTEEKLYTRAMIENPRFVYAEEEPTDRFAINFLPAEDRIAATTAADQDIPALDTSADTPSPDTPLVITPSSRPAVNLDQIWTEAGVEAGKDDIQSGKRIRDALREEAAAQLSKKQRVT